MATKKRNTTPESSLYAIQKRGEALEFLEIAKDEKIHLQAVSLTYQDIATRETEAKLSGSKRQEILLASMLILMEGERQQSAIVAKLKTPSARHIKTSPLRVNEYREKADSKCGEREKGKNPMQNGQEKESKDKSKEDTGAKWLPALREAWGMANAPSGEKYQLTDRQIALARNENCRQMIEQMRTRYGEFIPEKIKEELVISLKGEEQSEVDTEIKAAIEEVIKKINASKTREHLSAISLGTAGGELTTIYVGLANPAGDDLTVEGWKFVKLIQERDTYQLIGDPPPQPAGSEPSLFSFAGRQKKKGKRAESEHNFVYARFETASATLEVVRTDAGGKEVCAKAQFMLDPDYVLILCESLKYLREDRERFARLREKADLKSNINVECLDKLFTLTPLKGE